MALTRQEAEQIVKEAIDQGWAEEANSEEYDSDAGQVDMYQNYGGAGWDRSQAADHHDWVDGACSRCGTSCNDRTERMSCPGVGVKPQPLGTYHVELLFPGMYHSEKYWVASTDDWRRLRAKVDELREILKQAVERGWYSGSFHPAPRKSGKFGMYVEVVSSEVDPSRGGKL